MPTYDWTKNRGQVTYLCIFLRAVCVEFGNRSFPASLSRVLVFWNWRTALIVIGL